MSFRFTSILCLMVMPGICIAQTDHEDMIHEVIEFIAENSADERDYSEMSERLNHYRKRPLDINRATREQLQDLVFLSPLQISALLQHREKSGLFHDMLELQSIDGFSIETARWLGNFLILNPPELLSDIPLTKLIARGEHDLIFRFGKVLESQAGFVASDSLKPVYSGSSDRIFTRYRFNYANKLSVSF
ncbi:MAG: hypothetical protein EOP49_38775, partial [Sphingobacteriales bacterium]